MRVGPDCVTVDRGNRRLALLVLLSLLLHAAAIAVAFATRHPPEPDIEAITGGCWPRLRTAKLVAPRRHYLGPARERLGVMRVITARGDGEGEMRDLLAGGPPDGDADAVLARVGGVTVPAP